MGAWELGGRRHSPSEHPGSGTAKTGRFRHCLWQRQAVLATSSGASRRTSRTTLSSKVRGQEITHSAPRAEARVGQAGCGGTEVLEGSARQCPAAGTWWGEGGEPGLRGLSCPSTGMEPSTALGDRKSTRLLGAVTERSKEGAGCRPRGGGASTPRLRLWGGRSPSDTSIPRSHFSYPPGQAGRANRRQS